MNDGSGDQHKIEVLRVSIIGHGGRSQKKSSFSPLQQKIADLEASNQALAESEKKYRTLVENVNVGIYQTVPAPHRPMVHANPAMARISVTMTHASFLMSLRKNCIRTPMTVRPSWPCCETAARSRTAGLG